MSVQFFGWEVNYDDDSHVELGAAQEPQDRCIYTMYHGTSIASARLIIEGGFKPSSRGMLGEGVYVSRDQKKAQLYPRGLDSSERVVLELRVRVGRVKRIDRDNHPLQYTWNAHGYDTAWVPPNCGMKCVPSGLEEDCVFDPKRVRVVGIAMAPDTVLTELKSLVARSQINAREVEGGAAAAAAQDVCSLCKRKQQQGIQHVWQLCWGCKQMICPLMIKHACLNVTYQNRRESRV